MYYNSIGVLGYLIRSHLLARIKMKYILGNMVFIDSTKSMSINMRRRIFGHIQFNGP